MNTQTIKKLKIENIKGIKHIEIYANDINEICGENGAGKSSILDSIAFAFGGKKIIDKKAIRDGESRALINIETDDLIITRKFDAGGTTLSVKGKKGGKYAQKDLNGIFNMISFDPLEFSRANKEDQVNIIKNILGAEFNASMLGLNKEYDAIYLERTEIGREGKAIGDVIVPDKSEKVDVSKLMEDLDKIEDDNRTSEEFNEKVYAAEKDIVYNKDFIEKLKEEMRELTTKYKNHVKHLEVLENDFTGKLMPIFDTVEVKEKIKNASETNDKAAEYEKAVEREKEKKLLRSRFENRTDDLKELTFKKEELMKHAKLPVQGLSLDDDGVSLNGIPINQISSAEKLMLSTKIACSINSELKIIMIKDGSLLDNSSFDLIKDFSQSNGYQLWIETVGDGKTQDSIKISDGEMI